jgi:adenylosuccinate lyase
MPADAMAVKTYEQQTHHDVKAVEYFLRERFSTTGPQVGHWIHIGLTSEDTNSLALGLMLNQALATIIYPKLDDVLRTLASMAETYQQTPLLARTHGQPAIPTTFGKEVVVFAMRLLDEIQEVKKFKISAKLNGAVGTFAAQEIAFPTKDWPELSQQFIRSLGLEPATITTQIVPAETYTRIFSSLVRINSIVLDFSQDFWRYISDGYLVQTAQKDQVGSSTMPHKINPIDFENCEGNLGLSNSLLTFFIQKLPISRLQRDLSDSTVKRNFGVALGYTLLGYQSLIKGLAKVSVDTNKLETDLLGHWEVLSEAIQVALRAEGDESGYEKLRVYSQGKHITKLDISQLIETLTIPEATKLKLIQLTPLTYIGSSVELVNQGVLAINSYLGEKS